VRESDEWFEEPDDLDRVDVALQSIDSLENPTRAAAVLAFRVAHAQGFAQGNKRTALLLARWVLDMNHLDGAKIIPPDDRQLAGLRVRAAAGAEVEEEFVSLFEARGSS